LAIESIARVGADARPVADQAPPMHLIVAGGGELLDRYRNQASTAGVGDRVHFLGPVPHTELPGVLRGADVFLLTTQPPESFGIVLIEAMACGLPAIATEYPGVRAVIDDGSTGLVVKPQDPAAAAAAIQALIDAGPDGRARMGAAGREKAERLWSWPRLLDRMEDVYAAAIAARRMKLG
jgi:D-inositol-3-phosphate glycosyltransferase